MAMVMLICVYCLFPTGLHAAEYKVLLVFSYEEAMPWCQKIREKTDSVLEASCEIRYFYMDTKTDLGGGPQKAEEAYALYQEFQPDGVIAADDNAQSMFVVPYLKDKVKTPVIFCGVNAEAEEYGYPASNVTGILERQHYSEAVTYAQQIVPSIKTFGYMIKKSPVGEIIIRNIQNRTDTFSAKFMGYRTPKTLRETIAMSKELSQTCDLLLLSTMTGIISDKGKPLTDKEVVPLVVSAFGKAVVGLERQVVASGALCSLLRTAQEQGEVAAEMLLKAMKGTAMSQMPITRNKKGKAIINVTSMKSMGINPPAHTLIGAELIRTGDE